MGFEENIAHMYGRDAKEMYRPQPDGAFSMPVDFFITHKILDALKGKFPNEIVPIKALHGLEAFCCSPVNASKVLEHKELFAYLIYLSSNTPRKDIRYHVFRVLFLIVSRREGVLAAFSSVEQMIQNVLRFSREDPPFEPFLLYEILRHSVTVANVAQFATRDLIDCAVASMRRLAAPRVASIFADVPLGQTRAAASNFLHRVFVFRLTAVDDAVRSEFEPAPRDTFIDTILLHAVLEAPAAVAALRLLAVVLTSRLGRDACARHHVRTGGAGVHALCAALARLEPEVRLWALAAVGNFAAELSGALALIGDDALDGAVPARVAACLRDDQCDVRARAMQAIKALLVFGPVRHAAQLFGAALPHLAEIGTAEALALAEEIRRACEARGAAARLE